MVFLSNAVVLKHSNSTSANGTVMCFDFFRLTCICLSRKASTGSSPNPPTLTSDCSSKAVRSVETRWCLHFHFHFGMLKSHPLREGSPTLVHDSSDWIDLQEQGNEFMRGQNLLGTIKLEMECGRSWELTRELVSQNPISSELHV